MVISVMYVEDFNFNLIQVVRSIRNKNKFIIMFFIDFYYQFFEIFELDFFFQLCDVYGYGI